MQSRYSIVTLLLFIVVLFVLNCRQRFRPYVINELRMKEQYSKQLVLLKMQTMQVSVYNRINLTGSGELEATDRDITSHMNILLQILFNSSSLSQLNSVSQESLQFSISLMEDSFLMVFNIKHRLTRLKKVIGLHFKHLDSRYNNHEDFSSLSKICRHR